MLRINLRKIYGSLLVFCIFLLSGVAVSNIYPLAIPSIVFGFILLVLPIFFQTKKKKMTIPIYLLLFLVMCLAPCVKEPLNYKYCLFIAASILMAYLITTVMNFREFCDRYVKTIVFFSFISLGFYVILNFTSIQLPFLTRSNSQLSIEYRIGFVFNYLPYQIDRNCGIFWEPGLFATNIAIAYIIIVYSNFNRSVLWRFILIAAMLTTKSSAGYALLLFLVLLDFVHKKTYSRRGSAIRIIGVSFLFVLALFLFLYEDVFDAVLSRHVSVSIWSKLSLDSILNSQRGRSIFFWIEEFVNNPLLGSGVVGITEDFIWDTATMFMFAGAFGIMGLSYSVSWMRGIFKINTTPLAKTIILMIVFIILNKEPHARMLVTWIILFYLLPERRNIDEKNYL